MYFEVYLDSLFILQFILNLFLLSLVNGMMKGKVSKGRLIFGAAGAAVISVVILLLPCSMFFRMSIGVLVSALFMGLATFKINRWTMFLRFVEKLSVGTLLLGGVSLLILKFMPKGADVCLGLSAVLVVVGISFGLIRRLFVHKENYQCLVTLYGQEEMEVKALVDTGNTLVEPISGKPVAVLDKTIFDRLFPDYQEGFRAVPYHSVGKKHGIMPAYLLKCIKVETETGCMKCNEVYVGLSEEILSESDSCKMILNPKVFM